MNPPVSDDQSRTSRVPRRKRLGRLGGYAVASTPRPSRKTVRFRCRNCGQKILVDRTLRRTVVTCPTCQEFVLAPRTGRIWLEICGGTVLFLAGLAIGYAPVMKPAFTASAAAATLPQGKSQKLHTNTKQPKPAWFTNNQNGSP